MIFKGAATRQPSAPAKSATTGSVATVIGLAVAGLIIGNNPEAELAHDAIVVAVAGILGGLGNIARTAAKGASGLKWGLGQLFGWLG